MLLAMKEEMKNNEQQSINSTIIMETTQSHIVNWRDEVKYIICFYERRYHGLGEVYVTRKTNYGSHIGKERLNEKSNERRISRRNPFQKTK